MEKIYKKDINKVMPILQALAEGKTIQFAVNGNSWIDIDGDEEGLFLDTLIATPQRYHIKPEPTYRPFKDAEECWNEMEKHQPFGWVRSKEDESRALITLMISERSIFINSIGGYTMYELMEKFTFADGAVFGILEEE